MALPPNYTDNPAPETPTVKVVKDYGSTPSSSPDGANKSLLAQQAVTRPDAGSSSNAWMDQPSEDDLPDDFKVGVAVIDCDAAIRLAFIRKVYAILFIQLLATAGVSMALSLPAATNFMQQHGWIIWIPCLGSFAALMGVYWKRHQHPANLILLGLFTMFESMMIGTVVSYYESKIVGIRPTQIGVNADGESQVIQALFITIGIFLGLTIFTFQTKVGVFTLPSFLLLLTCHDTVGLFIPRTIPLCRNHGPPHCHPCADLPAVQRECRSRHCRVLSNAVLWICPL